MKFYYTNISTNTNTNINTNTNMNTNTNGQHLKLQFRCHLLILILILITSSSSATASSKVEVEVEVESKVDASSHHQKRQRQQRQWQRQWQRQRRQRLHRMTPNPNTYNITYDDGTVSPQLRLKVLYGEVGQVGEERVTFEETLDGFTVVPSTNTSTSITDQGVNGMDGMDGMDGMTKHKHKHKYVYVDVDDNTGEYVETNLIAGVDDPYVANIRKGAAVRRNKIIVQMQQMQQMQEEEEQQQEQSIFGMEEGPLEEEEKEVEEEESEKEYQHSGPIPYSYADRNINSNSNNNHYKNGYKEYKNKDHYKIRKLEKFKSNNFHLEGSQQNKSEDKKNANSNKRKRRRRRKTKATATATKITTGTLKNLVIPFRFSDHTDRTLPTRSDLHTLMNKVGPDPLLCPTGSVRDVYLQNSFNSLDLQSTVIDWVTITSTESSCANGESGLSAKFFDCIVEALDATVAAYGGAYFANYDDDDNGVIDGITFFHSGYAGEFGGYDDRGAHYNDRIWSHKWALYDRVWRSAGVRVFEYHINPAVFGTSGSTIGRIGVVAHETGHFLGLPDLYDYGDVTYGDGEGIGSWGLMANSWGFGSDQYYPPLMSAWAKVELGWVTPTVVTSSELSGAGGGGEGGGGLFSFSLRQACDNPDVILINAGFPSGEYLLIENRQPCGFDSVMPQGGLAIFHIDEGANNILGHPTQSGWPGNGNHYQVALLQADGSYDLERASDRGDRYDLFHGGGVNSIGPQGTSSGSPYPNTNAYKDGDIVNTHLVITNISGAGSTMTFDVTLDTLPTPAPTPAPSCAADEMSVTVDITSDEYPNEISWTIKNSSGTTVKSDGGKISAPGTNYVESACLNSSECYTFTINDSWGDGISAPFSLIVDGEVSFSNPDTNFSSLRVNVGQCGAAPTPTVPTPTPPTSAFCGNNICEVTEGEGCGTCSADCTLPTHCNVVSSAWNGSGFYDSGTYGIAFDVSVSKNLYFYEIEVVLMKATNVKLYMKNGSYKSDQNLNNWDLMFEGLVTPDSIIFSDSIDINSRFYAAAGSTTAFYISYASAGAFVFAQVGDSSNDDATIRSGSILREQNGNRLPSTISDTAYDFLENIRYDYAPPSPLTLTQAPSSYPSLSPTVKPPDAIMIQSGKNQHTKNAKYCLDIPNSNTTNGNDIILLDCDATAMNQKWFMGQSGQIRSSLNDSKCIEVQGSEYYNGTSIEIQDCNDNKAQIWKMRTSEDGTIESFGNSTYCIDDNGYNSSVVIRNCDGATNWIQLSFDDDDEEVDDEVDDSEEEEEDDDEAGQSSATTARLSMTLALFFVLFISSFERIF